MNRMHWEGLEFTGTEEAQFDVSRQRITAGRIGYRPWCCRHRPEIITVEETGEAPNEWSESENGSDNVGVRPEWLAVPRTLHYYLELTVYFNKYFKRISYPFPHFLFVRRV